MGGLGLGPSLLVGVFRSLFLYEDDLITLGRLPLKVNQPHFTLLKKELLIGEGQLSVF